MIWHARGKNWYGDEEGGEKRNMSGPIESSGEIEILCRSSYVSVGDRVQLYFEPMEGAAAPFTLRVVSPSGSTIVDTTIRDLPTGAPQSAAPFEVVVSLEGDYKIDIREMRGRQRGTGTMRVEALSPRSSRR